MERLSVANGRQTAKGTLISPIIYALGINPMRVRNCPCAPCVVATAGSANADPAATKEIPTNSIYSTNGQKGLKEMSASYNLEGADKKYIARTMRLASWRRSIGNSRAVYPMSFLCAARTLPRRSTQHDWLLEEAEVAKRQCWDRPMPPVPSFGRSPTSVSPAANRLHF